MLDEPEFDAGFDSHLSDVAFLKRGAARAIRPDPPLKVSDWALKHRVLSPEASSQPGPWSHDAMPYLVEMMDALGPEDPCHTVALIKPAQSAGSAAGENWLGHMMHRVPGPAMYVQATIKAAKDWKVEKFDPMIRDCDVLSPAKGGVVRAQKSRDGSGTKGDRIVFDGGFILLAGANSAATLRQHSIRYMFKDDVDAWEEEAGKEGDPDKMANARIKSYKRFGLSKEFVVSSPVEKQRSRIAKKYAGGDQRRWYMGCPTCRSVTDFDWEDVLREPTPPYNCRLVCPSCSGVWRQSDRDAMNALGVWIPTAPDADGVLPPKTIAPEDVDAWRYRPLTGRRGVKSYAITAVMNFLETWDNLAEKEDAAGSDPVARKAFEGDDLGRAYDAKDEAVAWETISARREGTWRLRRAPLGPLVFTMAIDVQGYGLYAETVGWGPNRESWLIDAQLLPGETDAANDGAWLKLAALVEKGVTLANGARVELDLIGVDTGFNAEAAYAFVIRRHNALALKGEKGWNKAAIFRAESAEVTKSGLSAGKAKKLGMKVWLVGGWGLKSALMIYLSRDVKQADPGQAFPRGFCHFPADATEDYFRQLVAESVVMETIAGEPRRVWKRHGENHYLDCRTYNFALTHYLGLWNWSDAKWSERAAELAKLAAVAQVDLFGGDFGEVVEIATSEPPEAPADFPPSAPEAPPTRIRGRSMFAGLSHLSKLNQ